MPGKYALVPPEMLEDLRRRAGTGMEEARAREQRHTSYARLRGLDANIREVLEDPGIDEDQKYAQYKRILQMHDNSNARDPMNVRQRPQRPPPPADHELYGVSDMFEREEALAARADAQRRAQQPPPPPDPVWGDRELGEVRRKLTTAGGVEILEALRPYMGGALDYHNPSKRQGLRIDGQAFPSNKLAPVINSLQQPHDYARGANIALAALLERAGHSRLITNRDVQERLLQQQLHSPPPAPQRYRSRYIRRTPGHPTTPVEHAFAQGRRIRDARGGDSPAFATPNTGPHASTARGVYSGSPAFPTARKRPANQSGEGTLVKLWRNV